MRRSSSSPLEAIGSNVTRYGGCPGGSMAIICASSRKRAIWGPSPANHGSTSFNSPVTAHLPQPPRASRIAASGTSKAVVGVAAIQHLVDDEPAGGYIGEGRLHV